jgi:hypothetical protein
MPNQLWNGPLGPLHDAAGTAYNTSAALTDVSPGGTTNPLILPGGTLQPGTMIEVEAWGTFSNTATPTLILGVYYGGIAGTALVASTAVTTTTAATNWAWYIQYRGFVRTTGTTGTIIGIGEVHFPTALTTFTTRRLPETAMATVTIDTTINKAMTIGAQWGTSSASNTLTCHGMICDIHG